jgi:mono/diheme cytochrome c family protein
VTLLMFACAGPETVPDAHPPAAEDPPRHVHGVDDMAVHMAAMAATRDRLRASLKDAYDAPVAGLDAADRTHGRALFASDCAVCHGERGKGDGPGGAGLSTPPADFTDPFHARYYSDAGRMEVIRHGVPGTGMVGWEGTLSSTDVLDVYAFVRTLRDDRAGVTVEDTVSRARSQ